MATSRTYGEACAAAHALDLVGERWALLIVRELMLGPKRFTDLRHDIANASPNVLSQRLRELEQNGIVRRRVLPAPAGSKVYELTEWGKGLEPVLVALGRWGVRSPAHSPDIGMSRDSHILGMRTLFSSEAAGDMAAVFELKLGEASFVAMVNRGEFVIDRGRAGDPDARLAAQPEVLAALLWGGLDLGAALDQGLVTVDGDPQLLRHYLRLFPLPEKVG